MKKVLAAAMCVILALALPLAASAAEGKKSPTNDKDIKIKEISVEVSELPGEINQDDLVEITFTIPRSGSTWDFGELSGLIEPPEPFFDEETCTYVITTLINTSTPGPLDIVFEFIMSAGKSHVRFVALYEISIEVLGDTKTSNITYYWKQDFSENYNGWTTGGTAGSITLDSGAALFEAGSDGKGPYSFFDGSSADWSGNWYSSIKVYLNPGGTTVGQGFDYIVTINNADGTYLDGYGFNFIAGSDSVIAGCIGLPGSAEVITAGWYTLQHYFYDNGGALFVDMKLIAPDSSIVLVETIDTTYLIPTEVGGNRYARFSSITDSSGILADDFQRYSTP